MEGIETAFDAAFLKANLASNNDAYAERKKIGKGYIFTGVSSKGSGIVTWDGARHVDVNLQVTNDDSFRKYNGVNKFVEDFQKAFLAKLPILTIIAQDKFPRGYGKIVSFKHDLVDAVGKEFVDSIPHWMNDKWAKNSSEFVQFYKR